VTTRRPARKTSTRRPARKTSTRGSARRTTTRPRRRQSAPATTLGAAVGTVVVSFLLGAPWSVRITLMVLLVVGVAGYLVWSRRP
jgi:Flp pilus assembly protein TadB